MILNNIWLTLIISLPTSNPSARMRIWRALKSAGCGVLRDGVYLLPESQAAALWFEQQAAEIVAAGGTWDQSINEASVRRPGLRPRSACRCLPAG